MPGICCPGRVLPRSDSRAAHRGSPSPIGWRGSAPTAGSLRGQLLTQSATCSAGGSPGPNEVGWSLASMRYDAPGTVRSRHTKTGLRRRRRRAPRPRAASARRRAGGELGGAAAQARRRPEARRELRERAAPSAGRTAARKGLRRDREARLELRQLGRVGGGPPRQRERRQRTRLSISPRRPGASSNRRPRPRRLRSRRRRRAAAAPRFQDP